MSNLWFLYCLVCPQDLWLNTMSSVEKRLDLVVSMGLVEKLKLVQGRKAGTCRCVFLWHYAAGDILVDFIADVARKIKELKKLGDYSRCRSWVGSHCQTDCGGFDLQLGNRKCSSRRSCMAKGLLGVLRKLRDRS